MRRLITSSALAGVASYALFQAYRKWYFPRDPARNVPLDATVVAPSDGRVVYLERVENGVVPIAIKNRREIPLDEIVKGEERPRSGTLLGIFLSPYDVHYQRSPIAGTVSEITYHPAPNVSMGDMFVRNLFRLEKRYSNSPHVWTNERNVVRIDGDDLTAYVVQIADQQVNRIDCYPAEGDSIAMGDKLGMIRWGSQVDLFIPDLDPGDFRVATGDKLRAGVTILVP
ncbi:MAG: phosphatidylserine decarboxylase [Acidimicrobiia bacterium]|nr:phosphatidylserine decarboxylase [Acidimicrobiia bacterium]